MKNSSFLLLLLLTLAGTSRGNAGFSSINFCNWSTDTIPALDSSRIAVEDKVFSKVEIEASFPGGAEGWKTFLQANLNGNLKSIQKAPVGMYTVLVQFIVNKEGKISDLTTLTNHGYGMEKEVIRVLKKSPLWHPAVQDGRLVKAYRKQPISFVVSK